MKPFDRGFRYQALGHSPLDERGVPSFAPVTRGAGVWSTQTATAADGATFIETGTSQNTARFAWSAEAGRRMLLLEPTRTNEITAQTITEVSVANRPDNWSSIAGVAGTDYDVIGSGPDGGNIFRLLNTNTNNRGVSNTVSLAAVTQYCWSAWTRRTVTAGAASLFAFADGNAGNIQLAIDATLHDWLLEYVVASTVGTDTLAYMCGVNDPPGILSFYGPQLEAGDYPTSRIPSASGEATRAAELCTINAANVSGASGFVSFIWSPQKWAYNTFTRAATLFTWGSGWRLDYDGSDDKFKVAVNGTYRAESAAQTFAANSLHRLAVRYGTFGQELTVNGVTTTNSTAWGSPTVAAYLGSRAASANCEAALYGDLLTAA